MNDNEGAPWLRDVRGEQVLPLIGEDHQARRVAAGPGTAKTFGLRKRVLRILHQDGLGAASDRVLVCAFNRVIAADLRHEIEAELLPFGLEPPLITTIHSLAGRLAGDTSRFLLPQEIEAMVFDIREREPAIDAHYGHSQAQAMRALREQEAGIADHPALATAVRHWLTAHGAALVGDLPRRVAAGLRGGDFGEHRYDHIIIDEFQDLTEVEIQLVLALGDRKQSIYAFRGNEGSGLGALPALVGHSVADRPMDQCQRCPSEIVLLANDVMAVYAEPLQNARGSGGQIHQITHATPEAEHRRLAQEIVRVFRARPQDKHLVLVTRRQWGYDLRSAIRAIDDQIRAQTVFAEDILETWPAREAFVFLSIVADPGDAASLRDWLSYREPDADGKKWKAPNRNAGAYVRLWTARGVLDLDGAREVAAMSERDLVGTGKRNLLQRTRRLKDLLDQLPASEDSRGLISHILDRDRWIVANSAAPELARDDIERLRQEAERLLEESDTEPTLEELVQRLRHRISTREPLGLDEQPDVKIVTLWGAKGLTADFVYIAGLSDEALPGPYHEDSTGLTEEEHEREQLRL